MGLVLPFRRACFTVLFLHYKFWVGKLGYGLKYRQNCPFDWTQKGIQNPDRNSLDFKW